MIEPSIITAITPDKTALSRAKSFVGEMINNDLLSRMWEFKQQIDAAIKERRYDRMLTDANNFEDKYDLLMAQEYISLLILKAIKSGCSINKRRIK